MNLFPPGAGCRKVSAHWFEVKDGDPSARALFQKHYSYKPRAEPPALFVGPGQKLVLITLDADALFIWRLEAERRDAQTGVNCAAFRNESAHLSSALILEAENVARNRWGNIRMFTFVSTSKVQSENPGYCFKCAGWKAEGKTAINKLLILAKTDFTERPEDERIAR